MEEVRSYWQVASIQHFCTLFQKPFKLPSFEPEELEQAFVIDVPEPPKSISSCFNSIVNNHNNDVNNDTNSDEQKQNGDDGDNENGDEDDGDQQPKVDSRRSSPDYLPPSETRTLTQQPQPQQQQNEDQQELHLLVKLAIALLKPHFNSKISYPDVLIPSSANWENYLRRLIDVHWVELEKCPSPLSIPIITPDGIELPKSLSFRELPLSDKIDIFSALCDYRLWCEDVSELLKDYPMDELRLESIGKDSHGYEYWYFSGTRLFKENIELSQDLICRKKRIKELEYKLIELEKARILKEQEDKKKAELERAKQLANEAREARLAAKRQHQQPETAASSSASKRKRGSNTPILPPRTGLRERRSSAAANNNDPPATPSRTLRSRAKPAEQQAEEVATPQNAPKATRGSAKQSKQAASRDRSQATTPEAPKKSPEEECREELEEKLIKQDERHQAWCIECESLEEWESFVKKFDKTKSTNERYLSAHLTNVLLPHIQGIYAKRAAEIRRKEKELLLSLATRRVSTRITSKRAQEEEEERQAQLREAEIQKKKAEAEIKLRAELEKEIRAQQNRFVVNGGTSSACSEDGDDSAGRYNLRQNQHHAPEVTSEFDGIIHPDKLAEFYEALELIIDTVRTSKHAWPFVDAVPDTVPGYYDLIKKPMDLKTLRTKVEFRQYKSLIEVEKDFQLLVNNCEKYNGPKNVYTKMVYKLWKSFRKNVQFYLERDLHMNEYETFLHPPVFPTPTTDQPASHEPSSTNDLTQTNTMTQNGNGNRSPPDHKDNYSQQQLDTYKIKRSPTSNGNDANDYTDGDVFETKVNMKTEAKPLATPNVFAQTNHSPKMGVSSVTQHSNCHDSVPLEFKPELNLQFQPTPIEVPVEIIEEGLEFPPEPVCEENNNRVSHHEDISIKMVYNKVKPAFENDNSAGNPINISSTRALSSAASIGLNENSTASSKDFNDFESISTVHLEESSYLKLKPFSRLDPTLVRLLRFLDCFGLNVSSGPELAGEARRQQAGGGKGLDWSRYLRVAVTLFYAVITSEVVYDVNLRQSRLLAEQKRSTPLLTFVIVVYSWLTLVIPLICDISLIFIGPYLFRFYSRTTATVCNGMFFGKKTSVDAWYYYVGLVLIAFLDVVGQVVLLGVWPNSIDTYMKMVIMPGSRSTSMSSPAKPPGFLDLPLLMDNSSSAVSMLANNVSVVREVPTDLNQQQPGMNQSPRITTYLLDSFLGETYAHSDLGVIIKIICLMIQFMHSYAFLIIIISLAAHYATAIENINENLDKYEFRRLLKQLIILRDSSEQISLMISLPFSLIIMLVFMRQIALSGVFIQSTMQPYENWAVSLQFLTCSMAIFMVFIYCDGLQNASKQTHRLKTEQTVINENRGGNQSIYEFLDYLDRLSKSIRITFFNIIAINKSSLVGLYGHILTLTFVTS